MVDVGIYIGPAMAVAIAVVTGVWKFRSELAAAEKRIDEQLTKQRRELVELVDETKRLFGETVLAAKQKMHDVELWATKELVTKKDVQEDIRALAERMDAGFDRLNFKLDRGPDWNRSRKGEGGG